jgi:hypothetical protein
MGKKVGNEGIRGEEGLILSSRAFTILSMTLLSNLVLRGSRIRSLQMGSMKRHTTEPFRIVRWPLRI